MLLKKSNINIHVYDYSVSIYPYLKDILKYLRRFLTFRSSFENFNNRLKYFKNYLNFFKNKNIFFYKKKIIFQLKKNNESDIDKVFSRVSSEKKILLKCDIEGSEYDIIEQISKYVDRIEMLIFEFHFIDQKELLFIKSIKKLQNNFEIVHVHGNNHDELLPTGLPITIEMTLINKKNIKNNIKEFVSNFPVEGLDKPNNPFKKDLKFYFSSD